LLRHHCLTTKKITGKNKYIDKRIKKKKKKTKIFSFLLPNAQYAIKAKAPTEERIAVV
jgi:hypothetical protein